MMSDVGDISSFDCVSLFSLSPSTFSDDDTNCSLPRSEDYQTLSTSGLSRESNAQCKALFAGVLEGKSDHPSDTTSVRTSPRPSVVKIREPDCAKKPPEVIESELRHVVSTPPENEVHKAGFSSQISELETEIMKIFDNAANIDEITESLERELEETRNEREEAASYLKQGEKKLEELIKRSQQATENEYREWMRRILEAKEKDLKEAKKRKLAAKREELEEAKKIKLEIIEVEVKRAKSFLKAKRNQMEDAERILQAKQNKLIEAKRMEMEENTKQIEEWRKRELESDQKMLTKWMKKTLEAKEIELEEEIRRKQAGEREKVSSSEQSRSESKPWECPVCFKSRSPGMELCTTPCGHVFCRTCISRVADFVPKCPLCKIFFYKPQIISLFL